mgnify:CR=1 FL=1
MSAAAREGAGERIGRDQNDAAEAGGAAEREQGALKEARRELATLLLTEEWRHARLRGVDGTEGEDCGNGHETARTARATARRAASSVMTIGAATLLRT